MVKMTNRKIKLGIDWQFVKIFKEIGKYLILNPKRPKVYLTEEWKKRKLCRYEGDHRLSLLHADYMENEGIHVRLCEKSKNIMFV